MRRTDVLMWLVIFAVIGGISAFGFSPNAVAQNNRCQQEKEEDDDNDDDGNLSAEDKARVKITLEEARAIALKRVEGSVLDEELEKENGRLQYAFDICNNDGKVWDVEISAVTGEVLQAIADDDDPEAARAAWIKTKNSVARAAGTVKQATVRFVRLVF